MNRIWGIGSFITKSGYSEHCKEIVGAIEKIPNCKLMISLLPWGSCGWQTVNSYKDRMIQGSMELQDWANKQPREPVDLVFHVSVPNEFKKQLNCPYIGITAGIEANKIHPDWLVAVNQNCDHLVVPSSFVKKQFEDAEVPARNNHTGEEFILKLTKPCTVIPESIDTDIYNEKVECKLDIDFPTSFNFFFQGQWAFAPIGEDRKNISLLIKLFKETFKGNKDVGLVLKVNGVNNSLIDRQATENRIRGLMEQFNLSEYPKIYLIHEYLEDSQLSQLYRHPKIKAFISLSHGEGWGRNEANAAVCDLPLMTLDWSGNSEFLKLGKHIKFDYNMIDVPRMHIGNLFPEGSRWAAALPDDVSRKMRKIVSSYSVPKEWAIDLGEKVRSAFNKREINRLWKEFLIGNKYIDPDKGKDKLLETVEFD